MMPLVRLKGGSLTRRVRSFCSTSPHYTESPTASLTRKAEPLGRSQPPALQGHSHENTARRDGLVVSVYAGVACGVLNHNKNETTIHARKSITNFRNIPARIETSFRWQRLTPSSHYIYKGGMPGKGASRIPVNCLSRSLGNSFLAELHFTCYDFQR
eukprot:1194651-Prorocentrum_minimum.AAC.11